jgi:hypothetical protein
VKNTSTKTIEGKTPLTQFERKKEPLNLIMSQLTVSDLLIQILRKIQLAAKTNKEIDVIIKQQTKDIYRWYNGKYANVFYHYDDWAIGFGVNFFRWERRYQYIDYILRENEGERINFRGKFKNDEHMLQDLTKEIYCENFWDATRVRNVIKKVREILEKEKELFHQDVVYFRNSEMSGLEPVGRLSEQSFHLEQRLHERRFNKLDAMKEAREAQIHGKWTRDVLNSECKRRFGALYKGKVYIFEPDKRTVLTVFDNPNSLK